MKILLAVSLVLLAGCDMVSPPFQVGDCISVDEFDRNPYRITAIGKQSYEVEFIRYPGQRHGLSFLQSHFYVQVNMDGCRKQPPMSFNLGPTEYGKDQP